MHTGKTPVTDVLLGVGVPLVAAVVWAVFAAPKSGRRLRGAAQTAVQMAFFAAGVAALAASRHPLLAGVFAAVVVALDAIRHYAETIDAAAQRIENALNPEPDPGPPAADAAVDLPLAA